MSTRTKKKQTKGKKSTKGKPKQQPTHRCTARCEHTCGEAGGKTGSGRPCSRRGAWGIKDRKDKGLRLGALALCVDHDPTTQPQPALDLLPGLNFRQSRFVVEYCGGANSNATEAASRAGYQGNRQVLGAVGHNLLRVTEIKAAIERRFEELSMPATEVTKRLAAMARASIGPLIRFDDRGQPYTNLTPQLIDEFGPLIKEIDVDPDTGRVTKVKLHDALAANREVAKIHQLYRDGEVNLYVHFDSMSDDELLDELKDVEERLANRGTPGRFTRQEEPSENGGASSP